MITRRALLCRAAGLAAAASIYRPLWAAPAARSFKIGACEWSLGRRDPSCFDVAKEIGLDGVQVDLGTPKDMHLLKPDVQQAYREAAQRTGLAIASLAIGALNSVPVKSDPQAAEWLAASVDVCKGLGVRITMPAFFARGDLDMNNKEEIDRVVRVVKEVSVRAEKEGLTIGLENYLSAEDNMRLIERIGSPAVKVYYDVGNSTDKGRDAAQEIRRLGKLICEFHAKDGPHMLGQGRIDFQKVRAAIDDIGYSGWIHLEAAHPHGLVPDYTADRLYLRGIFPEK